MYPDLVLTSTSKPWKVFFQLELSMFAFLDEEVAAMMREFFPGESLLQRLVRVFVQSPIGFPLLVRAECCNNSSGRKRTKPKAVELLAAACRLMAAALAGRGHDWNIIRNGHGWGSASPWSQSLWHLLGVPWLLAVVVTWALHFTLSKNPNKARPAGPGSMSKNVLLLRRCGCRCRGCFSCRCCRRLGRYKVHWKYNN